MSESQVANQTVQSILKLPTAGNIAQLAQSVPKSSPYYSLAQWLLTGEYTSGLLSDYSSINNIIEDIVYAASPEASRSIDSAILQLLGKRSDIAELVKTLQMMQAFNKIIDYDVTPYMINFLLTGKDPDPKKIQEMRLDFLLDPNGFVDKYILQYSNEDKVTQLLNNAKFKGSYLEAALSSAEDEGFRDEADAIREYFYGGRPLFEYRNSLGRPYNRKNKVITSVTFPLVRWEEVNNPLHRETITFSSPVTEAEAIRVAEEFLSQPLTEEYYLVRPDYDVPWREAQSEYDIRGDLLGDVIFLEEAENKNGNLYLALAS